MALYGIGDLHLSFSSNKPMDIFGENWIAHADQIKKNWLGLITEEDVVLIPGDISWATTLEEAMIDLEWIDELPGKKVLLRGNHDYWWTSVTKLNKMFKKLTFLQNTYYNYDSYAICGARGWDPPFGSEDPVHDQKIYNREIIRLKLSLDSAIKDNVNKFIVMMHYPPVYDQFKKTVFTEVLESYKVEHVFYGHIHTLFDSVVEGNYNGVNYKCVSSDYIKFMPVKLFD